jgi:drug/metabolite transporter (DMT)-like permease
MKLSSKRFGSVLSVNERYGHLAMMTFSLLVAGSFSFGKLIAPKIDPVSLTAARFFFGALLLFLALLATKRFHFSHYQKPWRFFVLGAIFVIYFITMFEALKTVSAISTSAIFTLMPFLAGAMDFAVSRRRMSGFIWAGLSIGAVGALWVIFKGSFAAFWALNLGLGEFLFFFGVSAHAAYAVLVPKLRRKEPIYATTLGVTFSGAVILVILFWPRIATTAWSELSMNVWVTLAYLTIFASLGTFTLVSFAAEYLPSAKVMAYTYMTPFWVVLLEGLLGHGWPEPYVLIGGFPILVGLSLLFFTESPADQPIENQ